MLGATVAAVVFSPLIVAALATTDFSRGQRRFPRVRVFLFALQYGINDSVEIVAAPALWLIAGCGRRLHGPPSIAHHQRLQRWSLRLLACRADTLLGLRFEITDTQRAHLADAPYVIVCRHVSLFDASLPALALVDSPIDVRGVIMAELLADPGFDLLYGRLGSVFIPRENGPEARSLIDGLGRSFNDRTVVALFPEGRLFRPEVRDRALASLAAKDPARAQRLSALEHSLPPRPGGFLALLAAAPDVDVVTINHSGLEPFARFSDLVRHVPLREPIHVDIRRTPRAALPEDADGLTTWLDAEWVRMDAWVTTPSQ